MADPRIQKLKNDLRNAVGRFVGNNSEWRFHPVYKLLQDIREYESRAFLCGGAVRDILVSPSSIVPRDLDIVIGYISSEHILSLFANYANKRMNRFGGLSVLIKDWTVDMWPLSETWAFTKKLVEGRGFVDFPKTTFLDIEAIAIQLFTKKGQKRAIYSKGFFEAILRKTIEINLEDNPFPALCVVKSLIAAHRLRFAIAPKLARYIIHHSNEIGLEEFKRIQKDRYGMILLPAERIRSYINTIEDQLRVSDKQAVRLSKPQSNEDFSAWLWSDGMPEKKECLFSTR